MKAIKTFEDFFAGNTSESDDNYAPGTANDPSAPWNQEDYDTDRNVSLKQSDLKFALVASDFSEYAIVKEKATGKMFAIAFEPDELSDYVEYEKIPAGKDDDGMVEYEYEYLKPDKYAIEAFVTDSARKEGTAKGIAGLESFMVTEIDKELAQDLYKNFEEFTDKYQTTSYRKEEIANVRNMMDVLKEFLASLK
jgi:hypothetical protein